MAPPRNRATGRSDAADRTPRSPRIPGRPGASAPGAQPSGLTPRRRSIEHRLRRLERKLVSERTEVAVRMHVDRLLDSWTCAVRQDRPTPNPLDFVHGLLRDGVTTPSGPGAINYLDECRYINELPDPDRLLRILLQR